MFYLLTYFYRPNAPRVIQPLVVAIKARGYAGYMWIKSVKCR